MRRFLTVSVLVVPLLVAASWDAPSTVSDDLREIHQVVQHYFDGMMEAKPELLRKAFHTEARLIGVQDDGSLLVIPVERWASSWEGRDARDVTKYRNEIVDVDVAGTAASVKTDLQWPDVRYIDYLSLLKVNGEWKIVNKIWTEER